MSSYAYLGNDDLIDGIAARLEKAGVTRTGEIGAADAVITFCTNMTALEDLYFGDEGLIGAMMPSAVAIDLSASTPNFANEMNAVATISDIKMVTAPLIVKNKLAEEPFSHHNLQCFAGGDENALEAAQPYLNAIFGDVHPASSPGAAQLGRAANTIQNTAEMVAAIEAMALFEACKGSVSGMDAREMIPDATSPEAFFIMQAVNGERFEGGYTVEMLMGELSAAIMTADDYEVIIPQAEAAFHLLELLAVIGGSSMTPAALALVYAGENAENTHGLDWSRAEALYEDASQDTAMEDGFDEDYEDLGLDEDLFGDDGFGLGYGYSAN